MFYRRLRFEEKIFEVYAEERADSKRGQRPLLDYNFFFLINVYFLILKIFGWRGVGKG